MSRPDAKTQPILLANLGSVSQNRLRQTAHQEVIDIPNQLVRRASTRGRPKKSSNQVITLTRQEAQKSKKDRR